MKLRLRNIVHVLGAIGLFILTSCENNQSIVNNLEEREANEIIVYLASKGVAAQKIQAVVSETAGNAAAAMYNINVAADRAVDAMSMLTRVGLPRQQGTTLLTLFKKSGLVSTDREETIRYQAGQAEELKNIIRKIDGVLDADVQISFPPADALAMPGAPTPKTTASVYVKHQGVMEDPNSHMETKIKRLVSRSINGLAFENVSVISDRSRIADIQLTAEGEPIGPKNMHESYVNIWSIVMTKSSLGKFRLVFFSLILLNLLFAGLLGWMVYRFYPHLIKKKEPLTPPSANE